MIVIPALLLVVWGWFYFTGGRYVETENAYLKANKIMVAPEVSGRVAAVAVEENQPVLAGSLLLRVDDAPYKIALAQARANLGTVRNEIAALRAEYQQKETELERAQEDIAFYEREFDRLQKLTSDKAVSESVLDEARHNLEVARLQAVTAQRDKERVLAQLGADPDTPVERHPRFLQAKAQVDRAELDLEHTLLTSPVTGVVGRLSVHPGDYAKAGTPALAIVETRYYVEANLKETELLHVQPGQPATVEVDAYPGRVWEAAVSSLSPATGAEFALLPAQNATGNWVKVVQRVPVRLSLEPLPKAPPLRAGMSVQVEIDTGYRRSLPGFLRSALAWFGAGS